MLMFAAAGPGQLIPATLSNGAAAPLFSAYALKGPDGLPSLILINKHADVDVSLVIATANGGHVQRLLAPRLDDIENAAFSGARVGIAGAWSPASTEIVRSQNGVVILPMPHGSAALVRLE